VYNPHSILPRITSIKLHCIQQKKSTPDMQLFVKNVFNIWKTAKKNFKTERKIKRLEILLIEFEDLCIMRTEILKKTPQPSFCPLMEKGCNMYR